MKRKSAAVPQGATADLPRLNCQAAGTASDGAHPEAKRPAVSEAPPFRCAGRDDALLGPVQAGQGVLTHLPHWQ